MATRRKRTEKVKIKTVVLLFAWAHALSVSCYADDIIDLGTLEVEGEIRQPQVQFFSVKEIPDTVLKDVAETSFMQLEKELLANKEASNPKSENESSNKEGKK